MVHVVSEVWGFGIHLYLRAVGFQHADMGVSHACMLFAVLSALHSIAMMNNGLGAFV